jgi:hypothetical protein
MLAKTHFSGLNQLKALWEKKGSNNGFGRNIIGKHN